MKEEVELRIHEPTRDLGSRPIHELRTHEPTRDLGSRTWVGQAPSEGPIHELRTHEP